MWAIAAVSVAAIVLVVVLYFVLPAKYRVVIFIGVFTGLSLVTGLLPASLDWLKYPLVVCAVGLAVYIRYTEVEPDLRFEEKRTFFLDHVCLNPMKRLREFDRTARLNIMEVEGIGPADSKSLNIIYDLFVEPDAPDKFMEMGYTQGVCGDAVRKGAMCYADISDPERPTFGLNAEQLKKTEHVSFVVSMPVKKAIEGPDGKTHLSDEVIGTVNIDSGLPDAENFYKNKEIEGETLLKRQTKALREISEFCSRLLS